MVQQSVSQFLQLVAMQFSASLIAISFVASALVLIWVFRIGSRASDLPPGPPTLPLLGNLHQMPKKKSHEQYRLWAKECKSRQSI